MLNQVVTLADLRPKKEPAAKKPAAKKPAAKKPAAKPVATAGKKAAATKKDCTQVVIASPSKLTSVGGRLGGDASPAHGDPRAAALAAALARQQRPPGVGAHAGSDALGDDGGAKARLVAEVTELCGLCCEVAPVGLQRTLRASNVSTLMKVKAYWLAKVVAERAARRGADTARPSL